MRKGPFDKGNNNSSIMRGGPCQTSLTCLALPRGVAGVDVLPHVEPDLHLGQAARGDRVVESAGHGDHCSCRQNITITAALSNTYTGPRLGHD